MRALARPEVIRAAMSAAAAGALLCLPRVWLWPTRIYPLWYLEALLFLAGTVLWAFVFAWHTQYTGRPVFTVQLRPSFMALVTAVGLAAALALRFGVDPALRTKIPEDYPASFNQWLAMTLFALAFTQMFLVFAPFAWLMRLFGNQSVAAWLTVLFGAVVLVIRNRSAQTPVTGPVLSTLLFVRLASGTLAIVLYLRGGMLPVWWWSLLVQSRHLIPETKP